MIDNVLIVIPCLNEERFIEGVLTQLLSDHLPARHHIVVADGGSTDGTIAILERFTAAHDNVTWIKNPKKLQSAGINLAVEQYGFGYDYLLRIDAHATYPKGYLKRLSDVMVARNAQSVVVPLVSQGVTWFQKAVAAAQNSVLGNGGALHRSEGGTVEVDHGHHALFDMHWFVKLGGYNPSFGFNEDAELDVRLVRAGGKIWLAGDVPVIYHPRNSLRKLCKQYYAYGGGRARTVRLHRSPLKIRQIIPIAIAPMCLIGLQGIIFLNLWPLAVPAVSWSLMSIAFGVYLSLITQEPVVLVSGPIAMAMHFSWSLGYWRRSSFFSRGDAGVTGPIVSGALLLKRVKAADGRAVDTVKPSHTPVNENAAFASLPLQVAEISVAD